MRHSTVALASAALALALAGCGQVPPAALSSMSPTPSATPSKSPTPTTTARGVELTGRSVAGFAFTTSVAQVESYLVSQLGSPDSTSESTGCSVSPVWTKTLRWKGLRVSFEGSTATQTAVTKLAFWRLDTSAGVPTGVSLADSLALTPTFAQLQQLFPTAKKETNLGFTFMTLPNGISYLGKSTTAPTEIAGGGIRWC